MTTQRPDSHRERLFTPDFLLACLTSLASFSSFYLLLTTLPVYVERIGGNEAEVGLIIGVFSITAVPLRLVVGRAADLRGKRIFILAGTATLAACSLLYAATTDVPSLLAVRVLHGAAWAAYGTAVNAVVADIVPAARRGEAMGYYGMFANLAMAIGPAVGVFLMRDLGFAELFVAAAFVAGSGLILAMPIREPALASESTAALTSPAVTTSTPGAATAPVSVSVSVPVLASAAATAPATATAAATAPVAAAATATAVATAPSPGGFIETSALFPSVVLTLAAMGYGTIISFLPIYGAKHGLTNPGLFFSIFAATLVAARGITGRLSDKHGRASVIVPGLFLAAVGLGLLAVVRAPALILGVAALYGLGFAAMQPTLMALIVDRARPGRRGAAMGMFATAMDLGIGGGSVVWGFVAGWAGYEAMYMAAAGLTLLTLAIFVLGIVSKEKYQCPPPS